MKKHLYTALIVLMFVLSMVTTGLFSTANAQPAVGAFGLTCEAGAARFQQGSKLADTFYQYGQQGDLSVVSIVACGMPMQDLFSLNEIQSFTLKQQYAMNVQTNQYEYGAVFQINRCNRDVSCANKLEQVQPILDASGVLSFALPRATWSTRPMSGGYYGHGNRNGYWEYLPGVTWSVQCKGYPDSAASVICAINRGMQASGAGAGAVAAYWIMAFPVDAYLWNQMQFGNGSPGIPAGTIIGE
jgi:hypothetical protein